MNNLKHSNPAILLVTLAASVLAVWYSPQSFGGSNASLDGVYEFVNRTVATERPDKETVTLASPDWTGLWIFNKGYYSCVVMKSRRDSFFDAKTYQDFGFECYVGNYTVMGPKLHLTYTYAMHPFEVGGGTVLEYHTKGDELILLQTLKPHVEDPREGIITTVLHRLR